MSEYAVEARPRARRALRQLDPAAQKDILAAMRLRTVRQTLTMDPLALAWDHRGLRAAWVPSSGDQWAGRYRVANADKPSGKGSWAIVMPCRVSARSTES